MVLSQMEEHAVSVVGDTAVNVLDGGIYLMEEDKQAEIFEDIPGNEGVAMDSASN